MKKHNSPESASFWIPNHIMHNKTVQIKSKFKTKQNKKENTVLLYKVKKELQIKAISCMVIVKLFVISSKRRQ